MVSLRHVSAFYQFFNLPRKTQNAQLLWLDVQIFAQHAGRGLGIGLQGTSIAHTHHRILRRNFAWDFDGIPLHLVFRLPCGRTGRGQRFFWGRQSAAALHDPHHEGESQDANPTKTNVQSHGQSISVALKELCHHILRHLLKLRGQSLIRDSFCTVRIADW